MDSYYVEIAGIILKLKPENSIAKKIINDLGAIKESRNRQVDIAFEFFKYNNSNYIPKIFSAKNNFHFNEKEFYSNYLNDIEYLIANLFVKDTVTIKVRNKKKSLFKYLRKLISENEESIKNQILSYSLLWYVVYIRLLQINKTFVHACAFELNNQTTLICGTGGCGKTSTLFKILEENNSFYLSEDFGIINDKGYTYFNPKPISIYASDIEYNLKTLKSSLNFLSFNQKIRWILKRYLLKRNPMIKINPTTLLKNRVKQKLKINNTIYFVRCADNKFTIQDIKINELVNRILYSSMRELKGLGEITNLILSNAPNTFNIPSFDGLKNKSKLIYESTFSKTNNFILHIPFKATPKEIIDFLKKNNIL